MKFFCIQLPSVKIILLLLLLLAGWTSAHSQDSLTEKKLAIEKAINIGPNQKAINFRAVANNGLLVLLGRVNRDSEGNVLSQFYEVNGKPERSYSDVTEPILSASGRHYMAISGSLKCHNLLEKHYY